MYRIANPLTLVTWYDKSTGKVLYTREMAAALVGTEKSEAASKGVLPAGQTEKTVPAYFIRDGKVCVNTIKGAYICDDNGDFLPEIDSNEEYESMKSALIDVLKAEGVKDPEPVFYLWIAPFSIDHGVLPKEYALGAGKKSVNGENLNCESCHDAQKGRLPQANKIDDNEMLSSLIETENGTIKFFGLGREVVTVPIKIPETAYEEAVRVFFNAVEKEDGSPDYTQREMGGVTYNTITTRAGDLLVNALNNGLDTNRHLVPIPVESSGIDGIAFALPEKTSKWKMKFEGIPVEVETEAVDEGEMPRRAIVIRLKNELPEMLGLENVADKIKDARGGGVEPVFTPVVLSHYIDKIEFNLADAKVASIDSLYLNYATIVKVRHSEGEEVSYEVDEDKFNPESITMREAINRGWASYDANSKEVTINVAAIRSNARAEEEGELALCILKDIGESYEVPSSVTFENNTLTVEFDGREAKIPVNVKNGNATATAITDRNKLLYLASNLKLTKVVALEVETSGNFIITFENATALTSNPVVKALRNDKEIKVDSSIENGTITAVIYPDEYRDTSDNVTVVLGESSTPSTATSFGASGGGGCSVTPATPASGLFNLGVLFSGLLGLFGFRRRKH
jgi:MYXO-CTERM domain-containing protein